MVGNSSAGPVTGKHRIIILVPGTVGILPVPELTVERVSVITTTSF